MTIREHITDRAHGMDVSHHQGEFILNKTWGQIDFAIAKFGEGYNSPYSAGTLGDFTDFLKLWDEGCAQVDIRGIYFYQRSGYSWEKQAYTLLNAVEKLTVKPHMLWCDVEKGGNIVNQTYLADTKRIMDYWKQNAPQYVTGLYVNKDLLQNYILPLGKKYFGSQWIAEMKAYPLWYAQYWFIKSPDKQPGTVSEWSNWDLWQYTDSGDSFEYRDGVRMRHYGSPDLDVYNGSVTEMKAWLKVDKVGQPPAPNPIPIPVPGDITMNKITITWPDGAKIRTAPHTGGTLVRTMFVNETAFTDKSIIPDSSDPANTNKQWMELFDGFVAVKYPSVDGGDGVRATVEAVVDNPNPTNPLSADVAITINGGNVGIVTVNGLEYIRK